MTKEQQDKAWACLPKEVRNEIKRIYSKELDANAGGNEAAQLVCATLLNIFNAHNLISDIEPEEMLMVERKKVQEVYNISKEIISNETYGSKMYSMHLQILCVLENLFGDKCLPDKKQPKLKFNKGDRVLIKVGDYKSYIGTIEKYSADDDTWVVIPDGIDYPINYYEDSIEPYTEPETKYNMEENKLGITKCPNCGIERTTYISSCVCGYNPKTDKVGKELNLCELLKGCEGEIFYTPLFGDMPLDKIATDSTKPIHMQVCEDAIWVFRGGNFTEEGECLLYPSRALYEKYPLDAYSAWMEWKESRKPKRWTPQIGERIFWVNANLTASQDRFNDFETQRKRRAVGNEFKTGKEAEQAAEVVKEALQKFHEENCNGIA